MSPGYYVLPAEVADSAVPENGILSRTLFEDDHQRIMVFAFDAGQQLSEHTASVPATIQILRGEATVTLGGDAFQASPGSLFYMQPELKHSVVATSPMVMLLTMGR